MKRIRLLTVVIAAALLVTVLIRQRLFPPGTALSSGRCDYREEELRPASRESRDPDPAVSAAGSRTKRRPLYRPDQPEMYARLHREIRTAAHAGAPAYPSGYTLQELRKARTSPFLRKRMDRNITWTERGPGNVSGRTRGLIVDPGDPGRNTWFAGSVSGGIWKTEDAGLSWEEKTPDLPNLATSTLAMSPADPDIIYAGTGEGFFNSDAVHGNGIFKSTDHGETWRQLAFTAGNGDFRHVNRIIVDPADPDMVLACTNESGIQKSTDGGDTWVQVYDTYSRVQQLIASPAGFDTMWAAVNSVGVLKSVDRGDTWNDVSVGLGLRERLELAVSPSNPRCLYAAVENGTDSDLYRSMDGGASWTMVVSSEGENAGWLGQQGWYDNTIAVHPLDTAVAYLGGIDIWKARLNGKSSFTAGITDVEENGTGSFLAFVNFGGAWLYGGMDLGVKGLGSSDVDSSDYTSVEVRFGPGTGQKAHRFIRGDGDYPYQDYVDVPFEVWDIDSNRQLMVSFRDQQNDGAFQCAGWTGSEPPREYIIIHAIAYTADAPDSVIIRPGGYEENRGPNYKCIYFIWPQLAPGASWDPADLPESNIRIRWEAITLLEADFQRLTRWYAPVSSPQYAHADHHNIQIVPRGSGNFRIINGNDGGVAWSDDGGVTWNQTLNGYNTTQFYGVDKKPGADEYIGGMQDNGTWQSPRGAAAAASSAYRERIGGDGYDTAWHYHDAGLIIGSLYYDQFFKSADGGQSWISATNGLTDAGDNGPFVSVLGKTKSDPDLLFTAGASGVWRSDDFADEWILSGMDVNAWGYSGSHTPVEVSIADQRIVWAGAYMNSTSSIQVSTDGGVTFSSTNNYADMGRITGIASHPFQSHTAYLLVSIADSPKILRTRDLGRTWEDISGFGDADSSSNGFPDVAVYDLVVMPYDTTILWACTEIGIFESVNNGTTWAWLDEDAFPAVSVWQADIVDDQIVMATHGRGIWSATVPELAGYSPPDLPLTPVLVSLGSALEGFSVTCRLRSPYDSTQVRVNGHPVHTLAATGIQDTSFMCGTAVTSRVNVALYAYKGGDLFQSAVKQVDIIEFNGAARSFSDNFNHGGLNFASDGFTVRFADGFESSACHSDHPYKNNREYTLTLRTPIIVSADDPSLSYRDIAVLEPGESGAAYGDDRFWDYVVLEASRDGRAWTPLADGYDARYSGDWLTLYNQQIDPEEHHFVEHTLDLQDTFAAGDTLILRFRMFTDQYTAGWGWVIDDLSIQPGGSPVADAGSTPRAFALRRNYPNPFNSSTVIGFDLPADCRTKLRIYDTVGRTVADLLDTPMAAGTHTVTWHADGLASGVYFCRLTAGGHSAMIKLMLLK
ncbi:T9SS type A sorting domain-containing protein [bacterium]|nr:T9SS type A sorting domain-containing protein [bacterium]